MVGIRKICFIIILYMILLICLFGCNSTIDKLNVGNINVTENKTEDSEYIIVSNPQFIDQLNNFLHNFVEAPLLYHFSQDDNSYISEFAVRHIIRESNDIITLVSNDGTIWHKIPCPLFDTYILDRFVTDEPRHDFVVSDGCILVGDCFVPKKSYDIIISDVKTDGNDMYYISGHNSEKEKVKEILDAWDKNNIGKAPISDSLLWENLYATVVNFGTESEPFFKLYEWRLCCD